MKELKEKLDLVIKETEQEKIKYLCGRAGNSEWSGVLFYSVKGSLSDIENLELTVEEILPLDLGGAVATEFEYNKTYVDFMLDNPELMNCTTGLIHSHQNMQTYFSATDITELKANAKNHNAYLSLVVNTALNYKAKLVISAQDANGGAETYSFLNFEGKEQKLKVKNSKTKETILAFECNVKSPEQNVTFKDNFQNAADAIFKAKPRPVQNGYPITPSQSYPQPNYYNAPMQTLEDADFFEYEDLIYTMISELLDSPLDTTQQLVTKIDAFKGNFVQSGLKALKEEYAATFGMQGTKVELERWRKRLGIKTPKLIPFLNELKY